MTLILDLVSKPV